MGGVPEHFNHPIHIALSEDKFRKAGIDLSWHTFPGGTGDMTRALRDQSCDICIVLTEGIIADIAHGSPSKIISGYVTSPLIWGVHTAPDRTIHYDEVFSRQIAISRIGSGSHLMPTVDALLKGKTFSSEQFVVINNIDGAIRSLNKGESDIFYWEKYTTRPYVEKGLLKSIGEFISPWPCFMLAATDRIIREEPAALDRLLHVIHASCEQFMKNPESPAIISRNFDLSIKDATYWFHSTEWATNSWVNDKTLMNVMFTLKEAGIVSASPAKQSLVWKRS